MNITNTYNFYHASFEAECARPKTFSEKAHDAFRSVSEEDKTDPAFTKVIQGLNPSLESQPDSMFLKELPVELQEHVFKFLQPRDLLRCLPICKQFHFLAARGLAIEDVVSPYIDLRQLERQIDQRLEENKSTGSLNGRTISVLSGGSYSEKINETLKQLSSLKAYCILLRMYKVEPKEVESREIDLTLIRITSLQKACQAKLEEIEGFLKLKGMNAANRGANFIASILNNPNSK